MKKFVIILAIIAIFIGSAYAGTIRSTPKYIILTEPTTNQVELLSQTYYYGASPSLEIRYNVLDSNGSVRATHIVTVSGDDFTAFTSTFLSTMLTNGDAKVWADILFKYNTQDTP